MKKTKGNHLRLFLLILFGSLSLLSGLAFLLYDFGFGAHYFITVYSHNDYYAWQFWLGFYMFFTIMAGFLFFTSIFVLVKAWERNATFQRLIVGSCVAFLASFICGCFFTQVAP